MNTTSIESSLQLIIDLREGALFFHLPGNYNRDASALKKERSFLHFGAQLQLKWGKQLSVAPVKVICFQSAISSHIVCFTVLTLHSSNSSQFPPFTVLILHSSHSVQFSLCTEKNCNVQSSANCNMHICTHCMCEVEEMKIHCTVQRVPCSVQCRGLLKSKSVQS